MVSARIASFLKDRGWVLNLVFIAVGSYFVAGAANAVVARRIRVVPTLDGALAAHEPVAPAVLRRRPAAMTAIADRNLLSAKREVINPVEETQQAEPQAVSGEDFDPNDLKPCSIPGSLRATLVADDAPAWSLAVIYDNATREPQVYNINEGYNQIAADAVLHEIRSCAVVVRRRDHFELCTCEGDDNSAKPPVAVASRVRPRGRDEPGDSEGVTKVSDTQYTVDRAEIDRTLSNLSQVATQARIVPSFRNGKPNGFKLFSIKPGSIYSKIGLMNGDVIQKINGYEMNSPDKALEIYQKLKDASSVSIDFQRRGQDMHFNYDIK